LSIARNDYVVTADPAPSSGWCSRASCATASWPSRPARRAGATCFRAGPTGCICLWSPAPAAPWRRTHSRSRWSRIAADPLRFGLV